MAYADLHIHSRFSDGTASVREIIARAGRSGAGLIAISDHNRLEGSRMLVHLCGNGLRAIPSVELCSLYRGGDHHVLGLGADLYNKRLIEATAYSRRMLDRMSEVLVERMAEDRLPVSLADYLAFPEGREEGGWKFLRYAVAKGLAETGEDSLGFYGKYDVSYGSAGFLPIKEVIDVIHEAGGRAVLAHPGIYGTEEECVSQARDAFRMGADGCECYYSEHSKSMTEAMLLLCRAENKLITAGSDYHGEFFGSSGDICETKTDESVLVLGDIRIYG